MHLTDYRFILPDGTFTMKNIYNGCKIVNIEIDQ